MIHLSERAWRELGLSPPYLEGAMTEASNSQVPSPVTPSMPIRPAIHATQSQRIMPDSGPSISQPVELGKNDGRAIQGLTWEAIPKAVESCRACALHQGRKRSVSGIGDPQARWLFVGEGPGAEEDQRGEPFVGPAGQLLDGMLSALNLSRHQDVYIANVVKCRPPANRTPEVRECLACLPFLERQIALIQPQIIIALGRVAAQSLLKTEINLGSLRGRIHDYRKIPLVVTFHPAYLLRNLPEKSKAWADLCLAKKTLQSLSPSDHS